MVLRSKKSFLPFLLKLLPAPSGIQTTGFHSLAPPFYIPCPFLVSPGNSISPGYIGPEAGSSTFKLPADSKHSQVKATEYGRCKKTKTKKPKQQQNNKKHWHFTVPGKEDATFVDQQPSREDTGWGFWLNSKVGEAHKEMPTHGVAR